MTKKHVNKVKPKISSGKSSMEMVVQLEKQCPPTRFSIRKVLEISVCRSSWWRGRWGSPLVWTTLSTSISIALRIGIPWWPGTAISEERCWIRSFRLYRLISNLCQFLQQPVQEPQCNANALLPSFQFGFPRDSYLNCSASLNRSGHVFCTGNY